MDGDDNDDDDDDDDDDDPVMRQRSTYYISGFLFLCERMAAGCFCFCSFVAE